MKPGELKRSQFKRPFRPLVPLRGRCCGKKRFATREAAEDALFRIARTTQRDEYPQRAYEGACGWFHLTKAAKRTDPPQSTREVVLERDIWCCAVCGRHLGARGANLHHRRNRGAGGSSDPAINQPSNLLTVCGSGTTGCHGWIGDHPAEACELGYAVSLNGDEGPADIPVHHKLFGLVYLADDGTVRAVGGAA